MPNKSKQANGCSELPGLALEKIQCCYGTKVRITAYEWRWSHLTQKVPSFYWKRFVKIPIKLWNKMVKY